MEKQKERKRIIPKFKINFTIVAVILLIILGICITPKTFQNDTYYTIKIGEYIKSFGIDMMDHFSWHENLSYTYPHWLYDLLTYLIYSVANFKGIYIATCILSAILSVSIFLVNSKLTKNKAISFLVTLGVLYVLQDYITARAQLVTFIFFIWEIFFIEKFLQNRKIGYAIGLIISSLLIANLHSATWPFFFVLFLPYIGEQVIAVIADTIMYEKVNIFVLKTKIKIYSKNNPDKAEKLQLELNKRKERISEIKIKREESNKNPYKIFIKRNKNVKCLVLVMIICILMGFITPIGDTPFTYLYKTMQGNTTQNISEHLPMTLINYTDVLCILVVLLAILIFTKTKIKLSDLFMIAGLCYLMLSTRRQLSMFVLIGSVPFMRLLLDLIHRYTKKFEEDTEMIASHILVVVALSLFIVTLGLAIMKPTWDDQYVNEKSYPVQACDYIIENIDLDNARFYNEYNFGSYMLFRGIPVFIDSRADLYSPEFNGDEERDIFTDFINTSGISTFYEDTFEKYNITHVILSKKSKTNMIITKTKDENYKELYSDDNFVVYERLNAEK